MFVPVLRLLADTQRTCQQRSSFVCEKHNITSVEVNPLDPQPGGLPCGNGSLSFRNKVRSVNMFQNRFFGNTSRCFISAAIKEKARKDSADFSHWVVGGRTLFQMIMSCLQCYTLMWSMKPMSFKYAKDECQSVRGTLVTISDQVEQGEECSSSESLIDQLVCVSDLIVLQCIFKALVKKETIVLVFVFQTSSRPFCQT